MARIVEGDAGKAICKEAERILPVAVVMGTRGRSLLQRFSLSLSLSLHCVCALKNISYCGVFVQCAAGKCERACIPQLYSSACYNCSWDWYYFKFIEPLNFL